MRVFTRRLEEPTLDFSERASGTRAGEGRGTRQNFPRVAHKPYERTLGYKGTHP